MTSCPKCGYANDPEATSCYVCTTSLVHEPENAAVPVDTPATAPEVAGDHAEISIQPDGEEYAPPEEDEPEDDPAPRPLERVERGGAYCRACGESNLPDRTFCMACGEPLDLPPTRPRERWWQRLVRRRRERRERGRKRRRGPALGELVRRTILLLVLVGALVAGFGPWRAEVRDGVSDAYWKLRDAVEHAVDAQAADELSARTTASYSPWARTAAA